MTAVADLKRATEKAEDLVFTLASRFPTGSIEFITLFKLSNEIHEIRQAAPTTYMYQPQSEWMGGNSDDPKNHKLREPNICPLPHRKFTPEEIEEAGAVCLGPVQWVFGHTGMPSGLSPLAIGTEFDGRKIVEVLDCDANDLDMPFLYALDDGEHVWIPVCKTS